MQKEPNVKTLRFLLSSTGDMRVEELNGILCIITRAKKWKKITPPSENRTHNRRIYSYILNRDSSFNRHLIYE